MFVGYQISRLLQEQVLGGKVLGERQSFRSSASRLQVHEKKKVLSAAGRAHVRRITQDKAGLDGCFSSARFD